MCGWIGLFGRSRADAHIPAIRLGMDRMERRGPDGEGLWTENGTSIGHRRLAVIDLDTRAAQPMQSACGRYIIAFNGEIYNFRQLRVELERLGERFRTRSDTEVLLALFARDAESALHRLSGMFTFVVWDRQTERGFIARDPYGIKPLYMAALQDGVLIGSQIRALLATGLVSREPDPFGQAGYWMLGSVPEPHTWFRDISVLPAGHCAWIEGGRVVAQKCWSDIGSAWRDAPHATTMAPAEIRERVRSALLASVQRHLVADVPVGVFLSGGIDSGALAGLMVEAGARSLEGVTIAYDEFAGSAKDEAPVAAGLAKHYGIRHTVRRVTRDEFLRDLSDIISSIDQPSVDGINSWYAAKAVAERGLKVVVSGVGGDELFQGYSTFRSLPRILAWRRALRFTPGINAALSLLGSLQASRTRNPRWLDLADAAHTIEGLWWIRRSVRATRELGTLMGDGLAEVALDHFDVVGQVRSMAGETSLDSRLALSQIESRTYLKNQLLRDSDWASMWHSVELRTPFVDAQLLADLQPALQAFASFQAKTLLAQAPRSPLPAFVAKRRKSGFGIPVSRWLVGREAGRGVELWQEKVAAMYAESIS